MLGKKDTSLYLDYASATPLDAKVFYSMKPYLEKEYGNPSALHAKGVTAKKAVTNARKKIAKVLSCQSDELIFTGSGTESNNLAITGVARANVKKGNHIIISAIEHKSVLETATALEKEGFTITIIPVNEEGFVDTDHILRAINNKTILVSIMYANNEIGTIQPIKEIAHQIKELHPNVYIHSDGCQAGGQLSLSVKQLGVDLFTLNGSKLYGPKGVGLLYADSNVVFEPIIHGGGQEKGKRGGTENVATIVGLAEAIEQSEHKRKKEVIRLEHLRDYAINEIDKKVYGALLSGNQKKRLANNVHFTIEGVDGETLLMYLDDHGILAATGSACTATSVEPSHVVKAIGKNDAIAKTAIRFSLGRTTTKKDINRLIKTLVITTEKIRSL